MHVVFITFLQRKCTTYRYIVIIKNKSYALGFALGRRSVSCVSHGWLRELLLYEYLLLVLFYDLLVLLIAGGSRIPPTHSLHACDDDATFSI
jgi:hypothetical protein